MNEILKLREQLFHSIASLPMVCIFLPQGHEILLKGHEVSYVLVTIAPNYLCTISFTHPVSVGNRKPIIQHAIFMGGYLGCVF